MAPLCSDPRQVVIALNPARRKAVLKLVEDIVSYMTSSVKNPTKDLGAVNPGGDDAQKNPASPQPADTSSQTSSETQRIQRAALKNLTEWRNEFLPKLQEILLVDDGPKILEERRKRREALDKKEMETVDEGDELISFREDNLINFGETEESVDIHRLQSLYPPISTRLTTIPPEDRKEIVSCVLLLLLSSGKYSAHSRVLTLFLASSLELPQAFLNQEEIETAKTLMESSTADKNQKEAMSAEAEAAKRQQDNKASRFWKVGLASVAGAAIIGVTGGLAAPLVAGAVGSIMGGIGLGGVASFLGIFWMNGALVGTLFGAYGAKMTGEVMDKYAKEVEDFKFIPLTSQSGPGTEKNPGNENRRLRVTIGINGWLDDEDDVTRPWRVLNPDTEVFALRYEMKSLLALGSALSDLVRSVAWRMLKKEIIRRTVLATLSAAMWPLQLLSLASNVDTPFRHASNRSQKAGRLLADALINKVQGERPVTLVGYSLGAGVIHSCLQSLAKRHAFGLIETVVIIGTPAPSDPAHWRTLRTVVSGNIFNVYSENDMVLGFVYRMHSLAFGVAGLQAIEGVEGIRNMDLSDRVSGHLRYAELTGVILKRCAFLHVNAPDDIDKDDVMKMKEEQGHDSLLDLDDSSASTPAETSKTGIDMVMNSVSGLSIIDPNANTPADPQLARRSTQGTGHGTTTMPLNTLPPSEAGGIPGYSRRLTAPEPEDVHPSVTRPHTDRAPWSVPVFNRPRAPSLSGSDDDEEYVGITMVDNDSDH
ncbi:hypothetical protein S40285_07238 [Stachybotrys chlorohalonatus IBT 40285]|uniref:DUF726 domain-containing protein n=1 Tax=Stachybotrys chlorohalonatus (strain IBT 40285) TaxID=1283841 RepID=A0A084QGD2_STAC4|nr:hypothetical protein S40285_07238 [Stachybotrys chlorohalonata IBT 40285]